VRRVEDIAAAAKSVRQMADGAGDVEAHFIEICNALAARTIKNHDVISARLREVGGMLDRANFDAMNFREIKEPERRDPRMLEASKNSLTGGLQLLAQADKELVTAQQVFDGTVSKLPKFAVRTNDRFKKPLELLGDGAGALHDDRKEVNALKEKAKKATESYQKSAQLALVN